MRNDKMDRIKKDILKSGIPLEIEILSVLRRNRWLVINQAGYLDRDTGEVRTLDIAAFRMVGRRGIALLIECKKSKDEMWLFYTQDKSSDELVGFLSYMMSLRKVLESKQDASLIQKTHLADTNIRVGTINYVPFKRGKDTFFTAQQQVTKALEYYAERFKGQPLLLYPTIVFDGEMYEFDIHEGDATVNPIDYLHFFGLQKEKRVVTRLIDVIQKSYFSEFLKIIDKEFSLL